MKVSKTSLVVMIATLSAGAAFGAGFGLYEASARGNAMGGGIVGSTGDATANYYNPANLTESTNITFTVGISLINPFCDVKVDGQMQHKLINATVGRLIYNEPIPQDLGFVNRNEPEHAFDLEVDFLVGKKQLGKIIDKCIRKHGFTIATEMLDRIKALGYKYSTKGAISVSIADMVVPEIKYQLVKEAEQKVVEIENFFRMGFITNEERYRLVVQQWEKTTADVTGALQGNLDEFNPIYMMADSGARGSMAQIRQLAGMRGLLADTAGRTIEIPVKANFREGLSVLEEMKYSRTDRPSRKFALTGISMVRPAVSAIRPRIPAS